VSVKDFGAVGDGVADDTAAIQAAIDATVSMISGFAGTGRTLFFPNGIYLCGDLELKATGQRLVGESKYGTLLKAKSGATCVIKVGGINYSYPVGNPLRNINIRETTIENFTIDYTSLVNNSENAAIRYQSSYGNSLKNITIIYTSTSEGTLAKYGLYFGEGCYTTVVENVEAKRVKIYAPTTDRPTTLTFINLSAGYDDIDNALAITFVQPIVQSTTTNDFGLYRIKCINTYSLTVIGGDFEDDDASHYVYYLDNVSNVVSLNNETVPMAGGYAVYGPSGITGKRFLQDDKTAGFEYREGNWTPALSWSTPGTSTIVPTSANGRYVRVGNMVTCSFALDNIAFTNGTATGYLILTGLPFVPKTYPTDMQGGVPTLNIGFPTTLQSIQVSFNSSTAVFKKSDGAGNSVVVADVSGSGKYLRGTFSYQCVN
jgi:hypothetical protein